MNTNIEQEIINKAKLSPKKIILPEGEDKRIIEATKTIVEQNIAIPVLIGNKDVIKSKAEKLNINLNNIEIVEISLSNDLQRYTNYYFEKRKHKGITIKKAKEIVSQPNFYAAVAVDIGDADGYVAGAVCSTGDTIRPALQIIKTKKDVKTASSYFLMIVKDKPYLFSDCGFVVEPDKEELAEIAITTAKTAIGFGIEPRVALLSFSTRCSARHSRVDKVYEATNIVKEKMPEILIDGELQLDAAIVPEVAEKKCPDSPIKGTANILVFPNLESGNIGYKLVQRFANARAIGPLLQGFKKPVNDLSRGCNVEDVILVVAATVVDAQNLE